MLNPIPQPGLNDEVINSDPNNIKRGTLGTQKLSGLGRKLLNDIEFDENEIMVCEIRKHPFGLFLIYAIGTFVTVILFTTMVGGAFFLQGDPLQTGSELSNWRPAVVLIGFILSILSIVVTAIGAYLYKSNILLVTSEKIAQLLYRTIFDRKISQLSIGDVQDVTVKQKGVFAHLFNYGTLTIETSGEQQNYTFTYAPFPYQCSKDIVGAHERNLQQYGN